METSLNEDERTRNIRICLTSAAAWRQSARNLRDHAAQPRLAPHVSAALLREAEASDRQASWWEAGAEDCRH